MTKWKEWKQPFSKQTADDVFEYQRHKINVAERAKFKVLEIWSSESIEDNILKCKEFLTNEFKLCNIKNLSIL